LARDVVVLASDEYEGRKPGTRGEDLTVAYLENRFKDIGIVPGNPDGSFTQSVPLFGTTSTASAIVSFGGRQTVLRTPDDFLARSLLNHDRTTVTASELIFAGYGIEAPEYEWNDYEGIDVKGKTVLVLMNEPSREAPGDRATFDSAFFKGVELSFHGTNRSKREVAFRKGASAIIFLFGIESPLAYQAIIPGYMNEVLRIDDGQATIPVQAAMPAERARNLLSAAGHNLDSLARRARESGFRAIPLGMTISFDIQLRTRAFKSRNVIGKLDGVDPRLRDEYVVFSAHWDAFGRDTSASGDQIRNGAVDDALGVAQLLAIAEALQKLSSHTRRSVLFLATTAEEAGLLGARYYAEHPPYSLAKTLANINFDNSYAYGPTADVINFGEGRSQLDDVLREVAATLGRTVVPDPYPAEGMYFRMDHFEFARAGVPAISPSMGLQVIGKPTGYGKAKFDEYNTRDYHRSSDEVRPDWDYRGAVQDAQMGYLVGLRIAEGERWPSWKAGAEFKARRDAMLLEKTNH
jgi:Zn-dependent M28 family amino/carboxypeptidase